MNKWELRFDNIIFDIVCWFEDISYSSSSKWFIAFIITVGIIYKFLTRKRYLRKQKVVISSVPSTTFNVDKLAQAMTELAKVALAKEEDRVVFGDSKLWGYPVGFMKDDVEKDFITHSKDTQSETLKDLEKEGDRSMENIPSNPDTILSQELVDDKCGFNRDDELFKDMNKKHGKALRNAVDKEDLGL